ncbi:hypothetical protein [Kitasatospora sp. NPDC094015]|uniref:hypothetical protein n=1 Tax=Kitasatospora sp. NPDC094015 TaxID=3155205 RepID=UPI00331B6ADF
MNFAGELWDDVKDLGGAALEVGKDIVMAPAEIAHWALGKMFGDADAELKRIAAELEALGKEVDQLGQEVGAALGKLTWHGAAADAFVAHAQGRVRELSGVADELDGLGTSIERLADVY